MVWNSENGRPFDHSPYPLSILPILSRDLAEIFDPHPPISQEGAPYE